MHQDNITKPIFQFRTVSKYTRVYIESVVNRITQAYTLATWEFANVRLSNSGGHHKNTIITQSHDWSCALSLSLLLQTNAFKSVCVPRAPIVSDAVMAIQHCASNFSCILWERFTVYMRYYLSADRTVQAHNLSWGN